MPKITGIDFVKSMPTPPLIIFTTAYPQYALEGYELDILDYLLKPVSFPRFLKAVLKARDYIGARTTNYIANDFFFIKCDQRLEKILISDVLYIEGMVNYIIVHTKQKKYITYLTFKGIEARLPQGLFIRIHKSYLVAIHAIRSIDSADVILEHISLPLSKNYKEEVMNTINKKSFKR